MLVLAIPKGIRCSRDAGDSAGPCKSGELKLRSLVVTVNLTVYARDRFISFLRVRHLRQSQLQHKYANGTRRKRGYLLDLLQHLDSNKNNTGYI